MVVKAAITDEADHRSLRHRAFHSQRNGKSPPLASRRPEISLTTVSHVNGCTRPDARVARVGHEDSIGGKSLCQFPAQSLDAYRNCVGRHQWAPFVVPFRDNSLGARHPVVVSILPAQEAQDAAQRRFGITEDAKGPGIIPPQFGPVRIDLDHRRPLQ